MKTDEQKEKRLKLKRTSKKKKRENETTEQKEKRLKLKRAYYKRKWENETTEQKEKRLKLKRAYYKKHKVYQEIEQAIQKEKIKTRVDQEIEQAIQKELEYLVIKEPNEDLLVRARDEVRSYIDEGQSAASSSQSIDLNKKQQSKQNQKIAQTQEQVEEPSCSFS